MPPIPTTEKRPFIPAVGVAQIEMIFEYLGQRCENVFHALVSGGAAPTVTQMQTLATAVETWERNFGVNNRHQSCSLVLIRVRDLSTQSGPAIEHVPVPPPVGTGAGEPEPGNVTVAIKWNTALSGRSFRGRTYHVGLPHNYVNGNQLAAGIQAGLVNPYGALLTGINESGANAQMVVLSYAHLKFWRDAAVATPITNPTVDPNLDSQRRRLAGRGQ